MKVLINKSELEQIVINTNSYLEKRDLSSITSHIYICAKDGILHIKATDHEIGLAYKISNAKIISDGEATANGKKLLDITKSLKDGEVTLETLQNHLYINQNRSKYRLPMQNPQDFPQFPKIENKIKFDIKSDILSRSLKKIFNSIDTNNPKFELNGALIDIKDGFINLVSTDTKRLGVYKINIENQNSNESLIIPKKAISEIQKIFYDNIEIFYDKNELLAVSKNFEFFTKLINGKFPNYENVIPKETKTKLILNREKIIDGIKTISMLSEMIKIGFDKKQISFESINSDNSEAKTIIDYENNIEEGFSFCIRNRHFLDFLSSIEDSEFELHMNSETTPFYLKSGDFLTLIVPITNL